MTNAAVQYNAELASRYNSGGRLSHPQSTLPYVTWLNELGDVSGKIVLDLACGDGYTSRMLAERGALVVGVDVSPEQISRAKHIEYHRRQNIRYVTRDVAELQLGMLFDLVTPSFLFHYADSKEKMLRMMESVASHLQPDCRMVALSAAPEPIVARYPNASHYTHWEGPAYKEGSPVRMHILDLAGEEVCSFRYYYWKPLTYEALLEEAGFADIRWVLHTMPQDMREQFHNWEELEAHNGSAVLIARKK